MIIGDGSLRNIKHLKSSILYPDSNNWFKVARKDAMLQDLIDTVYYFVNRIHKSLNMVVLQITKSHMENGCSEVTKQELTKLVADLDNKGISLILLGPIPYPDLTDEGFSRAFQITKWLSTTLKSHTNNTVFISNWDLQSSKNFTDNGSKLNYIGYKIIERKINDQMTARD